MGYKLRNTTSYETVVQLLALAAAILAPFMAFNFMDLELFSVSKSMFTTLWSSSINPWLCPPYVYILFNFIIVFIAALSFIHSNTIIYDSTNDHDHNQNPNASFIDSSLISQSLDEVHEPLVDDDDFKFHDLKFRKFEDTFKNQDDYIKSHKLESTSSDHSRHNKLEDMFNLDRDDNHSKVKKLEEVVVDKRELRKSRTFHEGGSRSRGRKERYVRILSQQELDQQVEAFINKFKKK